MKKIIGTLVVLAFSSTAFASSMITGDKILFQKESAFVSAVYSKSLCFDGSAFHATVKKCVKYDSNSSDDRGDCRQYASVDAVQPAKSVRQVPVYESGSDDSMIIGYKNVALNQSSTLNVKEYRQSSDGSNDLIRSYSVTVPSCR